MREPKTVDLSEFPDLIVIYLGMPVHNLRGLLHLFVTRKRIKKMMQERPEGLLRHESIIYSLLPLHIGMRQYWRNYDALETFARKTSEHIACWKDFTRDPKGTGFWHETYCMRGGMEAVFNDLESKIGLTSFAPVVESRGKLRMARNRLKFMQEQLDGKISHANTISEEES